MDKTFLKPLVIAGALLVALAALTHRVVAPPLAADSGAVDGALLQDNRLLERLVDVGLLGLEMRPEGRPKTGREPRHWSGYALTSRAQAPEDLPSSVAVPPEVIASGLPVASLVIAPDARKWQFARSMRRGPKSEVPGFLSLFRDGELHLATPVRIRVHGNTSREGPRKSFRIYFPGVAGVSTTDLGWDERDLPVEQVIASSDARTGSNGIIWRFANALALDISERIGCIVPHTAPTLFYLDGESFDAYVLTERINDGFFLRRGMKNISFTSIRDLDRGDPSTQEAYGRLRELITSERTLDFAQVERQVDLDNLARWFLSVLYNSTLDAYQGLALRDMAYDPPRWFWINWDMDLSYFSPPGWGGAGTKRTIDQLAADQWGDPRADLIQRLLEDSPEFRELLGDLFLEVWNYQVRVEFIEERVAHYAELARRLGVYTPQYFGGLEHFFSQRLPWLATKIPVRLGMKTSELRLTSPIDSSVTIDGHPVSSNFWGLYRTGDLLNLEIAECRANFSHWALGENRVRRDGPELQVRAGEVARIRAVYREVCS